MISDNLYLLQLTVYQYDKKKTKMDYSFIPVSVKTWNKSRPSRLLSGVSDEEIDVSKMHFTDAFLDDISFPIFTAGIMHGKKKEGKAVKTSMLVYSKYSFELEEDKMKKQLFKYFKKHFFLRRKYINFLKKKIAMSQF